MKQIEKVVVFEEIYKEVVFAIIRTSSADSAVMCSDAVISGGIRILEISLNTPDAISAIKNLVMKYRDSDIVIGAGTVLDDVSARLAIDAGCRFIVSPTLNKGVISAGNRYGVPVIPGIATPTELITAMELGVEVVKGFPGDVLGFDFIKSLTGPLPQARVIPVGNVAKSNLGMWIDHGAYALGIGSGITHDHGEEVSAERVRANTIDILECIQAERERRR